VKILKCADPTCNTHKGFGERVVNFGVDKFVPVPESWTCDWHSDPNTGAGDHVAAVEWARRVATSVDRS